MKLVASQLACWSYLANVLLYKALNANISGKNAQEQ